VAEALKKEFFGSGKDIDTDEKVLIERCRGGDSAAIERLILQYQDRIYNTILKICGNPDDAAELLQDTFVRVIEKIGEFESRSSFYTWAFSIAVNLTISHCRRKGKIRFGSIDESGGQDDSDTAATLKEFLRDDKTPDPAAASQNDELCSLVMKMLRRLSEEHRAVLVLREIEGMDYARIAETLNIGLGTVKSRISRARCDLRELLESALNER
jgi:RNA polymerase sigma-70 factor (ECF subfamily)